MFYLAQITIRTTNPKLAQLVIVDQGWAFEEMIGATITGDDAVCHAMSSFDGKEDLLEIVRLVDQQVDKFRVAGLYVAHSKVSMVVYSRSHL